MSVLGNRVVRIEDPKFLTTGGVYIADLEDPLLAGAAHVTYVRSPVAHADIEGIHGDDARKAPGVIAVLTADDFDFAPVVGPFGVNADMARPLLATGRVRFVGEPVAVIVAETPEQGIDAAELVVVDYAELSPLVDLEEANAHEMLLFPGAGNNTAFDLQAGHSDDLFDGCEVVVSHRF